MSPSISEKKTSNLEPAGVTAATTTTDVVVSGAGPAGLMLGMMLARFGVDVKIIDERADKTSSGRADGIQPKTIETLKQLRLGEDLIKKGVKVYDICFWNTSSNNGDLVRSKRELHFPESLGLLEPYILLVHQGMVEDLFLQDMANRGLQVDRNTVFLDYRIDNEKPSSPVICRVKDNVTGQTSEISAKYLIGADGAHSNVRRSMPDAVMDGESTDSYWGVLDGIIDTDFPDLWSKCAIKSDKEGSILCIPRERGLTRLYIELVDTDFKEPTDAARDYVMERAKAILKPFTLEWVNVEWFGIYRIGQRVATKFTDRDRVFIVGDAGHTHSPKAAQGMNVSIHDSWNLAWKLSLVLKGLANPKLLETYEDERRKTACDLIKFDHEHANAFKVGDPIALAKNFSQNVRFISGIGADYNDNLINTSANVPKDCLLKPGTLLPPARATRYIDANPVDIQIDIPMLGQFRVYFLVGDFYTARGFLDELDKIVSSEAGAFATALNAQTPEKLKLIKEDEFIGPERYIPVSCLTTLALDTTTDKNEFELQDMPEFLRPYKWTVYSEDGEIHGSQSITNKWFSESFDPKDISILLVRPDGYIGSVAGFSRTDPITSSKHAANWLNEYFEGILN